MKNKSNRILITGFLVILFFFGVIADARYAIYRATGEPDHDYWVSGEHAGFEEHYTAGFPGKFAFLEANGLTHRLLGQREINHVIRLNNGHIAELQPQIPPDDVVRRAHKLADLEEALTARGVKFLYLAAMTAVSAREENLLPAGVTDYSDENLDRFMEVLASRHVNAIDLRKTVREDRGSYYDYFYVTDHHWTTQAGFYAYTKIADWLEREGIPVDPQVRDFSNYAATTYPRAHLGSRGKRSGKLFAGTVDDFTLYTPLFETKLVTPDGRQGDFAQMLQDRAFLNDHDLYTTSTYDAVLGVSTGNYVNPLAANDATVLFVSDSMSFAVTPYLAISVRHMINVNAYEPWNLAALVEESGADTVIVLQSSDMNLISDESFDFGY